VKVEPGLSGSREKGRSKRGASKEVGTPTRKKSSPSSTTSSASQIRKSNYEAIEAAREQAYMEEMKIACQIDLPSDTGGSSDGETEEQLPPPKLRM
jgi:hypothetical protein